MTNQDYLKVATLAANRAAKILKKNFGRVAKVTKKSGNKYNLVTAIDIKIEKLIKKIILSHFPDHQILGEESGWNNKNSNYKWIVDPIDGTTNFIQGLPFCSISIALWDDQGPLVSVVCDPIHIKLYQAVRGKGAKLNGKKITVTKTKTLGNAFGGFGWNEAYDPSVLSVSKLSAKIITSARKSRVLASTVLQMAYVADGVYDFYAVNAIKPWDFAGSILLITEAGGKVTDWHGNMPTLATTSLIASNGYFHKQLLKTLKS